jgi:hypothetical protein
VLFQETEFTRPACAWGMEAGITSYHGDRFGEFCCNPTPQGQFLCAQNGCDAKVHQRCQWKWLEKARLTVDNRSPAYCPAHNIQRGDYIRWYFRSRKRPVPPDLLGRLANNPSNVDTSDIEPVPLLNSKASPALNGVAQNCHGEGNQARLGSTAEDTEGTSMSKERSNEAPNQKCVICFGIIDVNDRKGSVHSPCDHIFHRDCLFRWTEKGKILIWFVKQGRMHLLLTKEALTIVVLLTCLT